MKSLKDINVDQRMLEALDNALRQPYIKAMQNAMDKGYDSRQVLATNVTKTLFENSAAA